MSRMVLNGSWKESITVGLGRSILGESDSTCRLGVNSAAEKQGLGGLVQEVESSGHQLRLDRASSFSSSSVGGQTECSVVRPLSFSRSRLWTVAWFWSLLLGLSHKVSLGRPSLY
ncbi:hypothetical protein TNCV_4226541 [Trichonephila clavipes]|nr:hypothetical protein TNCV_4067361 [Trichonephila clavipes]GFT50086.1 hypothetical protein TNCV_4226541 [Trichonephila clavipes]